MFLHLLGPSIFAAFGSVLTCARERKCPLCMRTWTLSQSRFELSTILNSCMNDMVKMKHIPPVNWHLTEIRPFRMPCSREPISDTVKRGRDENKSLFYRYWKWANPTLGNPISEMTRNESVDLETKMESVTNSGKEKNILDSPKPLPRPILQINYEAVYRLGI